MFVFMFVCVSGLGGGSEAGAKCLPEYSFTLVFETESLTEPGAQRIC